MLDTFNFPTPQSSNYQEFYGGGTVRDWVKPRGASMVRFMLIGAGGGGGNGTTTFPGGGGGSGAVTSWVGPAMFVPDILSVSVGGGGSGLTTATAGGDTTINYVQKDGVGYLLVRASGGSGGTNAVGGNGGTAFAANQFTAAGVFTSTAGQAGTDGAGTGSGTNRTASTTTFLSGGAGGSGANGGTGGSVTPNYGYPVLASATGSQAGKDGYFIQQPILVGCGGGGGSTTTTVGGVGGRGGLGCGGGGSGEDGNAGGRGGDGAVFIWAW